MSQHCMVQVNETHTFFVTREQRTFMYNWQSDTWSETAEVPEERRELGCGLSIELDGGGVRRSFVIIAGGLKVAKESYRYDIELDTWEEVLAPIILEDPVSVVRRVKPFDIVEFVSYVVSLKAYGNEILMVGGRVQTFNEASSAIYSYVSDSKAWDVRQEMLADGRHEHVAFLVPDEFCVTP